MWPQTARELEDAQRELAAARPSLWTPTAAPVVGAVVVRFPRGQVGPGAAGDRGWAAAATLKDGQIVAAATVTGAAGGPYVPGLLALREGSLLEDAVRALDVVPDVLLVDATGRDHPRRAGLAIHLGAVLDVPTVGVTHRPLAAKGEEPAQAAGSIAPLVLDGERVGAWVRTRRGARAVAVHAGWRTDVEVAVAVVLGCTRGHRTPEPLRHARRLARLARVDAHL
jgi:deoxyribonuclease V